MHSSPPRTAATVAALTAVLGMGGCVSVPPATRLSTDAAAAWHGKTMAVTARPRAAFMAVTAGKAAFALVGAIAMEEAGKSIVQENQIEDPAPHLAQDLVKAAVEKYGVTPSERPVVIDSDDVAKLAQAAKGADLLMDVQSMGSQFRYLPTNWNHYVVDSRFILRLLDVTSGKVLGSSTCVQSTKGDKELPTRDELLANKAERLKATLAAQREQCLKLFKANVLNITD